MCRDVEDGAAWFVHEACGQRGLVWWVDQARFCGDIGIGIVQNPGDCGGRGVICLRRGEFGLTNRAGGLYSGLDFARNAIACGSGGTADALG